MSGKDTHGNDLLPGDESALFRSRDQWPGPPKDHFSGNITTSNGDGNSTDTDTDNGNGGSRRRRVRRSIPKSSRKYKKSKRVFRKKSRSTRRR